MQHSSRRFAVTISILIALLLLAMGLHITSGSFHINIKDIIHTILGLEQNSNYKLVIFEMRLPRLVTAALVGIGLAVAGVALQSITKNPLADPGILGINAGAGFAVVIFMFMFRFQLASADINSITKILFVPLFGFVGGLLAAFIILMFSYKYGRMSMERMILTGIAINTGFAALTLLVSLKMNADDFEVAAIWMNGSIFNANWYFVLSMLPWVALLTGYLMLKANTLDYFQLQDEQIMSLGMRLEKEKIVMLLVSVGIVSASVSVSGSIGFVGLMAPHIARQMVGLQHRYVVATSCLIGAVLVVTADYIAKTIFQPAELAVGIVVSLIGIPYFLFLLVKAKG